MRHVTALPRRLLFAAALALACVGLLAQACEDDPNSAADGDGGSFQDICVVDPSSGPLTALPISAGQKQSGTICPRGDRDWYVLDVPAGSNLLDLSASYPGSLTKVSLFARLYDENGQTPVANGELSSPTRTGSSSIATTLRVARAGRFYLEIGDVQDTEQDTRNSYVLELGFASDPDTHEPNDSAATAKPPDAAPGFLAYRADVDVFRTSTTDPNALLHMVLHNPAGAKAEINYKVATQDGTVVAQGVAPPAPAALDVLRAVAGKGDYFVSLSYPDTAQPDRRPEAGYSLALSFVPEPDSNEIPTRNDAPATATATGAAFTGALLNLPARTGYVASLGDRDVFRVDVTSGAPAVLEADVSIGPTPLHLALDILTPHAASPCTNDGECVAINVECDDDYDCELSHKCLVKDNYTFCKTKPCQLCEGAGACVPGAGGAGARVCAASQFTMRDEDGTKVDGAGKNRLRTAQPLFTAGPTYVVVHDFQDKRFDPNTKYDLTLRVAPEPDSNDRDINPTQRNNFYNPYPLQSSKLDRSQLRAKSITLPPGGTWITGHLSYQSDEDWYSFPHPCPGKDCQLVFEWRQPGPSAAQPAFLLRTGGLGLHESWTYTGAIPTTSLSGPVTGLFGNTTGIADTDCRECSFAAKSYNGTYYLQVRDVRSDDWDFSAGGEYGFRLDSVGDAGCPLNCSQFDGGAGGPQCGCYCASTKGCPGGPAL